jgi:hypothetical protein
MAAADGNGPISDKRLKCMTKRAYYKRRRKVSCGRLMRVRLARTIRTFSGCLDYSLGSIYI